MNELSPAIVVIDPRLDPYIDYPRKIPENRVTRRHERVLALLAYFAYWATEIKKRPELLQQVLK